MSSEETRPLLQSEPDSDKSRQSWLSPAVLIIPTAVACRLAAQLPQTTAVYLIQQLICRQYYLSTDPSKIPPNGPMSDEMCDAPSVKEIYATVLTATTLLSGIGSLIAFSVAGTIATRYGRIPTILGAITLALSSNVFLITSQFLNSVLEIVWLILWILTESLANAGVLLYLANVYTVDVVGSERRTAALSYLTGWTTFADGVSFLLGGNITTYTNKALPVYYIAAAINAAALVYTTFILPESFPAEKREELRRERAEEASRGAETLSHSTYYQRILRSLSTKLGLLKNLKPTFNEHTGRRNWRLVILSIHALISLIGGGYVAIAMVIYLINEYHYKPADTGYTLATYSLSASFSLTFLIPPLIRWARRLYKNRGSEETVSDRIDVHLGAIAWLVEGWGFLLMAHMTTRTGQYIAVGITGLSSFRNPVVRSLVAATSEPLKQGETLAALEVISGLAYFISPLIMGPILTSTINNAPTVVFWVNAALATVAALLLLLVRDSDRYQKPHED